MARILNTHDLAVVAEVAPGDRAQYKRLRSQVQMVFQNPYASLNPRQKIGHQIAEPLLLNTTLTASERKVFANALHPYTQALLSATPSIDPAQRQKKIKIHGELPSPLNPPTGCAFHKRCPKADARCESELPLLRPLEGRQVACHHV